MASRTHHDLFRDAMRRTEMKRDDVFPSKYLKASDLKDEAHIVEIDHAPLQTLKNTKGEDEKKTVLYFTGAKKCMPLNKTNWDAVADICGEDTEDWPGKKIELYPTTTQMGGKIVDCVRIRKPKEKGDPLKAKPKSETAKAEDEIDDEEEIPF
jgi:hypothetical protein